VIEEAKAQMDRVRFLSLPDATPIDHLITQHQAILDAIADGRGAAADQAMKDHLREILKSLPRLSRAFPDMFDDEDSAVQDVPATRPARRKATR
jgi:DNA-binding GntR family transcriptional regulator